MWLHVVSVMDKCRLGRPSIYGTELTRVVLLNTLHEYKGSFTLSAEPNQA